jgi:Ras-related protein Rab-4B
VYDITKRVSFENLERWLTEVREHADSKVQIILVGNKSDLGEQRQVTFVEGSCLAQEHEMLFLEASAHSSDSVEEIFLKVARSVLVRLDDKLLDVSNVALLSPASLSLKAPTKPMSPSIYDCC